MNEEQKVVTSAGFYSATSFLTQIVTIIAAFLTRRFLGPVQIGVWAMVQIVLVYANYSNLGSMDAITRDIPFYNGKGEHEKAESLKNTAFTFSVLTALIVSAGVIAYCFWKKAGLAHELFYGLLFTAAFILLQRINAVQITVVRAYKHFSFAGKLTLVSALVNALLVAWLSYQYKLYGFMLAMGLSYLFSIVLIRLCQPFRFGFSLKTNDLKMLLSYGFPLMLLSLAGTFFETLDKVMITKYLGFEALGLYSIAQMTFTYIQSIPNSISIVIIPNLHEKFGRMNDKKDLRDYLEKSNYFYSNIIPLLVGFGWVLVPYLVQLLLPKFTGGIEPLRFLILGSYFLAVNQGYYLFIFVIRKHLALFPLLGVVTVSAFILDWLAIRAGWGIGGVALTTTAALFIQYSLYFIYSAFHVYSFKEALKIYASVIAKFALMVCLLFLVSQIRVGSELLTALVRSTLYAAAYIPLLVGVNKRFGILSILANKLTPKKMSTR